MSGTERPTAFYAFPSRPEHLVETIEIAIKQIVRRQICDIQSWRSLHIGGRIVINTILKHIQKANLFIADLTGVNPNVLFELGYAVARNKRVWLTVDKTNPENARILNGLEVISDLGYVEHENFETIYSAFLEEYPYADLDATLLSEYASLVDSLRTGIKQNDVFYLPSAIDSTASKQLGRYLKDLRIQTVTDDPLENSYEPLSWYLNNLLNSRTVITHLQNKQREDSQVNNAKYSFIAGLARGLDIPVVMVAPAPFDPPFDYRGLLQVYRTGAQCVGQIKKWVEPKLLSRQTPQKQRGVKKNSDDIAVSLLKFHIGESIAENEEPTLSEYFVQTGYFARGIETTMGVFIGRKGTGKTANLYQIRRHFQKERNDLVVTVKPVSFRLESFVRLLSEIFTERDIIADFVERVWRIVIYSDIAVELCDRLTEKPSYYDFSDAEESLINHMNKARDFIHSDFGEKMNAILEMAQEARAGGESPKSILGIISKKYADPLLRIYHDVLVKFQKVVVLVDNLDKVWDVHRDVVFQSQIIFGLLGFQNTLRRDLQWTKGDVRLLIFLREDIFSHVLRNAREPDKIRLSTTRITWADPEQLARVIEERFIRFSHHLARSQVWSELFCDQIEGMTAKDFLLRHIMPRPRDLIHVTKTAISNCINREHEKLQEVDIRDALVTYFNFLLDNLITEYGLYYDKLRDLILHFLQKTSEYKPRQVIKTIMKVVSSRKEAREAVNLLIHVSFLGVRRSGKVQFAYSNEDAEKLQMLLKPAFKIIPPRDLRLVVHPAYYHGLHSAVNRG